MKKKERTPIENIERYNPDFNQGLSEEQVNYMREHGHTNESTNPTNKTYTQIILGNVFTFFNVLMIAVAGLLLLVVGPKVITNLMFYHSIFFYHNSLDQTI